MTENPGAPYFDNMIFVDCFRTWKCLGEIKKRKLGNPSLEMFRRNQKEQAWKCLGEIKKRKLGNV